MKRKAVFLDRDGVINDNKVPVNKPEDLVLYPWTVQAIEMLNNANLEVFVVTNQGGIEMGYFTESDLDEIHTGMLRTLNEKNVTIKAISYCPHFKTKCQCRKPLPGMLLDLAKKYDIDLAASFMVGDREMDIDAGHKAGCTTIKIGKSYDLADYTVKNLLEATQLIVNLM